VKLPPEWVEKAEFFRREARRHLEEEVYWATCFEALQVALMRVHEFTHDLSRLLSLLEEAGLEIPRELYAAADALTPHYSMARYPGRKPVRYDEGLAKRCVEYMESIVGWVLREAREEKGSSEP